MSHSLKQILRKLQRHPREQTVFHNRLQNNSTPHLDPNHGGQTAVSEFWVLPGQEADFETHVTQLTATGLAAGWLLAVDFIAAATKVPINYAK